MTEAYIQEAHIRRDYVLGAYVRGYVRGLVSWAFVLGALVSGAYVSLRACDQIAYVRVERGFCP